LADCVKDGVAFHHAGLLYKQKKLIEDNFKNGLLKCIVATPTLAYGVNLPAFRVVIRDLKRYYAGLGARFIPVLEYKQFAGRCGRPDYDEFGESILIAKSEDEAHELTDKYILGEPEEIHSKLAFEPILRMHTLALIASGFVKNEDSLMKFFEKTFFSYQYGDVSEINEKLESILEMLVDFDFIMREDGKLIPTKIGKRVSELYVDPFTAHHIIKCLERAMRIQPDTFSYLHMITDTLEMKPFLSVSNKEFEEINNIIATKKFLTKTPNDDDLEFDDFLKSIKTTLVLQNWIDELTEDQILIRFKVTPGDLWTRLRNTDWLLYASQELALLLGHKKLLSGLRKIRVRVKYGVKEELMPLARLQQIGRVRARKLFNSGLKTISDLKKIPLSSLERIVGLKIAAIIKKQLGEKVEEIKEQKQVTLHKEW
jgi:helicase